MIEDLKTLGILFSQLLTSLAGPVQSARLMIHSILHPLCHPLINW